MPGGRLTVRTRLTLVYAGLFLLAGVVLLAVTYLLVDRVVQGISVYPQRGSLLSPQEWSTIVDHLSAQYRHRVLGRLLRQELAALGVLVIAAGVIGYLVAGRALAPVQRVTAVARQLSETNLHERIDMTGPDDAIKELADTFDAMSTRLQQAFDAQRRFVANASHELRTPLAINRTLLEVALADPDCSADLQAIGRTLLATGARQERLIEGLLLLARTERELTTTEPVDLAEAAAAVLRLRAERARRAGVAVHADLSAAPTAGDAVLLERLVANLLDNAITHNDPAGGEPTVWVRTRVMGGAAACQVSNTGPPIAGHQTARLFEPFHRLPPADGVGEARRGNGLGLSIVASVAHAHRGTAQAVPRPGGGLVVTVRFPCRAGRGG